MRTGTTVSIPRISIAALAAGVLLAGLATAVATAEDKPAADKPAADQPAADGKKIAELVTQLGDNDFRIRNQAQKDLTEIGAPAKDDLVKAMKATDMEVKQRAEVILGEIAKNEHAAASKLIAKGLLWSSEIKTGVAGSPAVTKELVIAAGADRKVYAIEIKTGKQKWVSEEFADNGMPLSDPAAAESVAIVHDLNNVYAIDLTSGKLNWKAEMTAAPAAGAGAGVAMKVPVARFPGMFGIQAARPVVADGIAYVSDGAKLYGFDAKSGKRVWEQDTDSTLVFPAVGGGVVCYAAADGSLKALDPKTGKGLWSEKYEATGLSNLTYNDGMFLCKTNNSVLAVDAKTGKKAWTCNAPAPTGYVGIRQTSVNGRIVKAISQDPEPLLVAGGAAYLMCGQEVLAVDVKSGEKKWQYKVELKDDGDPQGREMRARLVAMGRLPGYMVGGTSSVAVSGETAYVILNGSLIGVDLKIGQPVWQYPTRTALVGKPVLADGVLYFATGEMTNIRGMPMPPAPVDPATGAEEAKKDDLPLGLHALRVKAADAK